MSTALSSERTLDTILKAGRNCWTADAAVDACGLLIDGRNYYRAFYSAACGARSHILIAGWKFHSRVRLLRGRDASRVKEVKLLPLLRRLCEETPDLHVYILAWNYSLLYVARWEWFLSWKFNLSHERLHFRFADHPRFAGSHHQKFVVIDGRLAFLGGLDFNADDWDDRDHRASNAERADEGVPPDRPYHDMQAYLVGDAAAELGRYFQQRWFAATNEMLALKPVASAATVTQRIRIQADRVALSRNHQDSSSDAKPTLQICRLYWDAIAAAEELIYIENQYFSAQLIGRALAERMQDPNRPKLDIVLILPKHHDGRLESIALEPPRLRLLEYILRIARHTGHRLGVYYSGAGGPNETEIGTLIHSKLLIVDDRFLTTGSANTSNRSMWLDTELNVSWEASPDDGRETTTSIRQVRVSLLTEHCGLAAQSTAAKRLERAHGLVRYLDRLARLPGIRLRHLTREAIVGERKWLEHLERWGFSLDPEMGND